MAKVQVNESLIGRKVQLEDGTSTKITDVTTRGYKVAARAKQLLARNLVKVGSKFVEVDSLTNSKVEDSGKGYAEIIDADTYEEVHGKKMKGAKSTSKKSSGKKSSGKKSSGKKSKKSKAADEEDSGKKSKKSSGKKSKKSKPAKKQFIESFADKAVLSPLVEIINKAIRGHLDDNYEYDGELEINTEVLAPEIVDDPNSPVIAINSSVVQNLPEQEIEEPAEITMSVKARKLVTKGLWEKAAKAQARAEEAFGAPLTLGALLESSKGTEFKFVGARKTEEGARLVFDATGANEVIKQLTISKAAGLLTFVTEEEDDFDDADLDQEDDFDFDDADLVDGDELDEEEASEMASTLTETVFEQFEDADEAAEWLLENYTFEIMRTYVEENYEESRDIAKIIKKEDVLAIAELIANAEVASGEDDEDEDEFDPSDENPAFDLPEDEDGDLDEFDDGSDDLDEDDEELEEEGDYDEEGEDEDEADVDEDLDLDAMIDALVDGDHLDAKKVRKMEDAEIVELYETVFGEEVEDEAEEMPTVDEMVDELIDASVLTPSGARKMEDEDIVKLYLAQTSVGDDAGEDEDEDLDEEFDADDLDEEFDEEDGDDFDE